MIFINEMEDLKLYKKKFHLPIIETDKMHNSAAFLLSPDYKSSVHVLSNPLIINNNYYKSYFIEKDITYFINQEGALLDPSLEYITEGKKDISGKNYGIPELKKYPMPDENHVLSAIRFFNYVDSKYEKELANNINKTIDEFNMRDRINVGDNNRFKKYFEENYIEEVKTLQLDKTKVKAHSSKQIKSNISYNINKADRDMKKDIKNIKGNLSHPNNSKATLSTPQLSGTDTNQTKLSDPKQSSPILSNESSSLINETIYLPEVERIKVNKEESYMNEGYMRCKVNNEDIIVAFNENMDADILNENAANNKTLYKILYKERYRTNKQVFNVYKNIRKQIPWIKKTYIGLDKYKELNLIIDLFYYNQTFFKNSMYTLDKGVQLYFDFIDRFISDKRLNKYNYKMKTVIVPLDDWYSKHSELFSYSKDINPISMIARLAQKDQAKLQMWKGIDFVFITDNGYFKVDLSTLNKTNISRFKSVVNKLLAKTEIVDDDQTESKKAIVANIISKIEDTQKIQINNLTGNGKEISKDELKTKVDNANMSSSDKINDKEKVELVKKIQKAAEISNNTDEAIEQLDKEPDIATIIQNLSNDANGKVQINAARAARITKLQTDFLNKTVKNKTVKDFVQSSTTDIPLPSTDIKIDTINDEWDKMSYMNFEEVYDPNEDIMNILNSLSTKTRPVAIKDIKVEDTSTSEDYIDTYNVQMEDASGNRFTIKFDVPHLVDNKFLMLRGNQKTINGQLMQIPIMKTDEDTVQIVSNYNKIFIRRFGTTTGKSFVVTDRIIKALSKFDKFTYSTGDNSRVCGMYQLPIDYIDIASLYNKIDTSKYTIYFNQDLIKETHKVDETKGIPIAYDKKEKTILYYDDEKYKAFSYMLLHLLEEEPGFIEVYNATNSATRYTYSKASILNTTIPLIVIMGYCEGLIKAMEKANIEYELSEKRLYNKKDNYYDAIKFKDGYINYELNYNSSLLMNGLKECNTDEYSLSDLNNKAMFLDFLEIFGTRILADGLDNFYDLMIDPITTEVLIRYELPTDFIELLAYSNILLCDNKYIAHTDMRGRRYRSNEIIAGYAYKAISESYGAYMTDCKRKDKAAMTMKQSSILDKILQDPTASDVSVLNDLGLLEAINTVSYKGLSGMNSDRSYSLDKRTFDKSMSNLLGLSTGFAGNVGISRQATMDMNVESKRGYLKIDENPKNFNITKTFTATEALTPFGTIRDDPFRSAMTFIQTAKHGMRIKNGTPSLISNGADQALPYMTPNIFSFKAKDDGKVIEKNDDYMIIKYKNGTSDFVDLRDTVKKNSNGGFFVSIKLDSDLKVGSTVKKRQIVAYDKLSYSDKIGGDAKNNIAYNLGALSKIAILNTDEGYEDSAIISEWLSDAMTSDVVIKVEKTLSKDCNILDMVKKGDHIQEGDPLLIYQNAFEDEDVNILLKNLAGDQKEISDIGRIPVKSHVTGMVEDIKIYRTVEKEDLSDSLRKKVNEIEKPITQLKKTLDKNGIEGSNRLSPDYKLDNVGKTKNVQDGVLIEFYLKYEDKMSIGDKLIYYSALKGVVKDIFPEGKEPKSEFRLDEKIHSLLSVQSISGRMVCSVLINVAINKVLVELDRKVKEILGIEWKYIDEMK